MQRAGYSDERITEVLAGTRFPALVSTIVNRSAKFRISPESLMERLGGSQ